MMASILIAIIVGLGSALILAVLGAVLAPRPEADHGPGSFMPPAQPSQPWAAKRCATEDLRNCHSPETPPFGDDARMAARRGCTAAPPSASSPIFRRAL